MISIGKPPETKYFNTADGKYQKALESDGLITIVSKGKTYLRTGPTTHLFDTEYSVSDDGGVTWHSGQAWFFYAVDISLTEKGRKYVTGKTRGVPVPWAKTLPSVYEYVTLCDRAVVDVGEIRGSNAFARADYTWSAKLTPFGARFREVFPAEHATCYSSGVNKAYDATFELKRAEDGRQRSRLRKSRLERRSIYHLKALHC